MNRKTICRGVLRFFTGFLGRLLRLFFALALGIVLLFFFFQRDMIYYPIRAEESDLLQQAENLGLLPWRNDEGERIGWCTAEEQPRARLMILHGNAGHALHREGLIRILQRASAGQQIQYFVLEYPGYGSRAGKPSEAAFRKAAQEAVRQLRRAEKGRPVPLVVLGESLGTGVACWLAGNMPDEIKGLILLTPFDSLVSVAAFHYPWLPVSWILRDRFDSSVALRNYHRPVAFLLAENDEVVPAELGMRLANSYNGPKLEILVPGSDHNGIVGLLRVDEWDEVLRFVLGAPDGG